MKKILGLTITIIGVLLFIYLIGTVVYASYKYERDILYNWNLADKSSTLDAKSDYMNKFIIALESQDFSEYNAIFLKTPDNYVQNNINAVKTLRDRLNEIKGLDPNSFEYQTAIQQITAQEQGEAYEMMSIIRGGWILKNYPLIWDWISALVTLFSLVLIMGGILLIAWDKFFDSSAGDDYVR